MCGIFGAIGKNWNQGTIRALAWANRERGTDSLGFFDSSGKMIKAAVDPCEALAKENISRWLDASELGCEKASASWFVAGHTRLATRGKVNRQNSHPFRYGKIIGCHNGMVDAPGKYTVDSQYLFDSLCKAKGNYNKAWGGISGYWGIVWFDGESFFLQAHNGDVNIGQASDGCWYYSSNRAHLVSCIGASSSIRSIGEGETLKFTLNGDVVTMEVAEEFVSTALDYWTSRYGCSNSNSNSYKQYGNYQRRRHGRGNKGWVQTGATDCYEYAPYTDNYDSATELNNYGMRDYDDDWRQAWEEYATQSEHSIPVE